MKDTITARQPLAVSLDRGLFCHQELIGSAMMPRAEKKPSSLRVTLSWVIVLIPLGWGVVQSVVKSLPLFQVASATASPTAPWP
jgi:hypothetical protein